MVNMDNYRHIIIPGSGVPTPGQVRLYRNVHSTHVRGSVVISDVRVCQSTELPWRDNARNVSCIPDGTYLLKRVKSAKFGDCLHVVGVPGRSGILIHPGNDPHVDSRGCILPGLSVTAIGAATDSRRAMALLMDRYNYLSSRSTYVYITIKSLYQ